jgi:hypothetical protein
VRALLRYGEEKGLIPRICETLFHFIDKHGQSRGLQVGEAWEQGERQRRGEGLRPLS